MACKTCDSTVQGLGVAGERMWWCARCGSLLREEEAGTVTTSVPALVERVKELRDTMVEKVGFHEWDRMTWHRLGLFEAIYLPGERPP